MMLWYFIMVQLVVSNADMMCSYNEDPRCYVLIMKMRNHEYCSGNNKTLECMKEKAIDCVEYDSNSATHVPDIFTCQAAKERNETYPQLRTCIFAWGRVPPPAETCYEAIELGVLEYRLSGNKEDWDLLNCDGARKAIKCIKETAMECDVEDAREVLDMESVLKETCREGTNINKMYQQHKTCTFQLASQASEPCHEDKDEALQSYPMTGNDEADKVAVFKLTCRYNDPEWLCLDQKMLETCGQEAASFHRKLTDPLNDLVLRACIENSASGLNTFWTLLLQAATVVVIIKVSNFCL